MTDWLNEYRAVRSSAGRIDRSRMGKIAISGEERYSWLQGMVSQDVRRLEAGEISISACILTPTGHVISDLTLIDVRYDDPFILAVLPPQNTARVLQQLDRLVITEDVELRDVSESVSITSFQGPLAVERYREVRADGRLGLVVEADHTGSGGYDIFVDNSIPSDPSSRLWLDRSDAPDIGPEAQEVLRIEAGIPLFGAELDESVIALEANLGPTHISLTKGCYVGQEIIARIDSRGHTNRALTGLVSLEGSPPTAGLKLFAVAEDGAVREVGRITSAVTESPAMHGSAITLSYVRHEFGTPGTRLHLESLNSGSMVEVARLPFYPPD